MSTIATASLFLTGILMIPAMAMAEVVEFDGLIKPYQVVEVGAPVEGIVGRVRVDRSSLVKRGQVLVQLESSVEMADLKIAKAKAKLETEIGLQKTVLDFAKRINDRIKGLDVITTHEKDQAESEVALARYKLARAKENKTLARLELKKSQAVINRYSVRSPVSGVVVERYVSPGEYVNSQPLLQVAQIHPLLVEVVAPAQIFGKIKPGMTATIVPELTQYGSYQATVSIVDRVIDSASNTFGVHLKLPNKKWKIPSGLKCLVQFDLDVKLAQRE